MKRRNYTAEISRNGSIIANKTTHAWNSGIRATEDLMRMYARGTQTIYHGNTPNVTSGRPGDPNTIYTRAWTNAAGDIITAAVWELV